MDDLVLISDKPLKVNCEVGIHCFYLAKDVATSVPLRFVPDLIKAGAKPYNGGEQSVVAEESEPTAGEGETPDSEKVKQICAAMQTLIEENDPTKLTASQIPKASALEDLLGFKTSKIEREVAWAEVEG